MSIFLCASFGMPSTAGSCDPEPLHGDLAYSYDLVSKDGKFSRSM